MASTSDPKVSCLLVLLEEELTYGVTFSQNTTYKHLLSNVRRKLNIGIEFDVSLSYSIRKKAVRIVDDEDVDFFVHEVCKHKSELQSLFVLKILKPPKVTPRSTQLLDFDLNLYPEGCNDVDNDFQNIPKKTKTDVFQNNNDHIRNAYTEPKWKCNTFTYMPTPPEPPKLELKSPKPITDSNSYGLFPGRKFNSKEECMYEIGEQSLIHGFEYKPRKSDKYRYDVKCVHRGCEWVVITSQVDGSSDWEIKTVRDNHTCSRTKLIPNHRNATSKLLGHLLLPKLQDSTRIYKAKDIVHDMKVDYNCDITHLMMNCKIKGKKVNKLYWKLCKVYTTQEFHRELNNLAAFRIQAYNKLIEAGVSNWSRAYSVGRVLGLSDSSQLARNWFKKTTLKATYEPLIFPTGDVKRWETPNNIQIVEPPLMGKRQAGRPKNKDRIRSRGEEPRQISCGRCGVVGHNRSTCKQPMMRKMKRGGKSPNRGTQRSNGSGQSQSARPQNRRVNSHGSQRTMSFGYNPVNLADP
ncbi:transposase, MuDR, MULE transposase domain protein [Artemisia annua]|uniref:Transposase, MuDR, MULE transposase domain protein n=1 Tax=Artemisia annua TaxID=35608 RepID=A0A2U1QIA7_ARTAN|nr:transposase, MuDR, MULE transposase domain protein [Artemisia annua]